MGCLRRAEGLRADLRKLPVGPRPAGPFMLKVAEIVRFGGRRTEDGPGQHTRYQGASTCAASKTTGMRHSPSCAHG